ncbi:MAG: hypothetical protein IJM09_05260, partial [Neisseriaceae bacterium]|nr:hypothetical protein [Neisseriaceae bacterium]
MSNDNQNPDKEDKKISDKEKYFLYFSDDADKKDKLQSKRYLALQEAQKVRQFEIELYWKRTAFFWAFITVIYVALFSVIDKFDPDKDLFFVPAIFILSGLGFFFSVAWHLINKGSKFWQENWEKHVSLLEEDLIGPLYDVFINPNGDVINGFLHPTKAFDFSVSKVNMWASFTMCICSFFGWFYVNSWLLFS